LCAIARANGMDAIDFANRLAREVRESWHHGRWHPARSDARIRARRGRLTRMESTNVPLAATA